MGMTWFVDDVVCAWAVVNGSLESLEHLSISRLAHRGRSFDGVRVSGGGVSSTPPDPVIGSKSRFQGGTAHVLLATHITASTIRAPPKSCLSGSPGAAKQHPHKLQHRYPCVNRVLLSCFEAAESHPDLKTDADSSSQTLA